MKSLQRVLSLRYARLENGSTCQALEAPLPFGEGRYRVDGDDMCQLSGHDHLPFSRQCQPHVGRHRLSA